MTSVTTQLNNTLGSTSSSNSNAASIAAANAALIASGLNGTASTTSSTATQSTKDATTLLGTTDQFLNLLLAQLKYQDPTQPMKGTEFIDSISRLSDVEQGINTNKNLENISTILQSSNSKLGNPVSYVNQTIDFNSSQVALTNGIASLSYNLDATNPPTDVTLVIKDAKGNVVVNTQATNKAGLNNVKWDGTDLSGNQLPDGLYTISVQYPDPAKAGQADQGSVTVPTFTSGKVTGADFTGTEPALNVGDIQIPLTAIRKLYSSGT